MKTMALRLIALAYLIIDETQLPWFVLSHKELLWILGPLEFSTHGTLWTMYVNGMRRKGGYANCMYLFCLHGWFIVHDSVSQSSLTEHKVKDKIIKNFKYGDCRVLKQVWCPSKCKAQCTIQVTYPLNWPWLSAKLFLKVPIGIFDPRFLCLYHNIFIVIH